MKKIIACALATVLLLCALTSCGATFEENVWFSGEMLEECLVTGMPEITGRSFVKRYDDDIYVSMPNAELKAYVESVYEFLKAQNFEYLGTRGEQAFSFKGLFTEYYFKPVGALEDFNVNGDWIFVYSDGSTDENGDVIFCILSIYECGKSTLSYGRNKEFTYTVQISLANHSERPLAGSYVLEEPHEHVDYDEDNFCDVCGYDFTEGQIEVSP